MGIQRQRLKELLLLGEPAFEFRENVGGQGESKERKETGDLDLDFIWNIYIFLI